MLLASVGNSCHYLRMTENTDKFTGEVAAAVRSLLGEQRRTVTDLATALHISRATASERVNGGSPFAADELEKVAGYFGLANVYVLFEIAESIAQRKTMAAAS